MEEVTALASTVNDTGFIGGLRSPFLQPDRTDNPAFPDNRQGNNSNGTDVAEFSPESLQLSIQERFGFEQQAVGGIAESDNGTETNDGEILQNLNTPIGELLEEEQPSPLTEPASPAEPLDIEAQGAALLEPEQDFIGATIQTEESNDLTPPPGVEVPEELTVTSQGEEEAQINPFFGSNETGVTPSLTLDTDTGQTEEVGAVQANEAESFGEENSFEAQAERAIAVNEEVNTNIGLPADTPATDGDRAQQVGQFQERLLLQNVGTQLAQAVPPASIISVLG
jgi:hypothetical protein